MSVQAKAWLRKAISHLDASEYAEALDCFNKSIEAYPLYAEAWYGKACALKSIAMWAFKPCPEEALACINEALKINPRDDDGWNFKGCLLSRKDDRAGAIQCFEKAIELNPSNSHPWVNKANNLWAMSKDKAASIKCYDEALMISPDNYSLWENKGGFLENIDDLWGAVLCYKRMSDIFPGSEGVHCMITEAIKKLVEREKISKR